jgi:membrane protease subunit (stomatin/prohibitin family)
MSLFRFIRNELVDVIDWVEQDKDVIMWKFPHNNNNIKYGAQLIVRESQTALFVDQGTIADLFEPGRFELVTENMPVLTTLRSWKHGFNSPFKADIYYLSTRVFTGLKWGTPNPIILRDPEFKQVRVRAFGAYFIRISDVQTFFREFAGTHPILKVSDIENALRDIVSPKFAEALAQSQVSVMDLVSNYTAIGDMVAPVLQEVLTPFGIELTKFQVTSTSLPKEVEEFYDKMTNMNMVDNMSKFTQFQTAQGIEKAASNPGGSGEGIGMGMGFGMANMMSQQMQQQNQPQQAAQQPAQEESSKGKETRQEIIAMIRELGTLKEEGILTEEEFNTKKDELLARL